MSDSYEHALIEDQAQWRAWLDANHSTSPGIWLVTWKKASGRPLLAYDAIVEEALAYGWVDSRPRSFSPMDLIGGDLRLWRGVTA
jgi:uncharacterized protein YdeI (YjbR/CyaY-like superfamily)